MIDRNAEALRYLTILHGQQLPPQTVLEVRVRDAAGVVRRHLYGSPAEVRADRWTERDAVWVGVGPRRLGRGTKADVVQLPALWVDLDGTTSWEHVVRLVPHPSMVVSSGGGFHLYWLLAEPVRLAGQTEVQWCEEVMFGLASATGGDTAACEVARLLGLPGTYNPGRPPDRVYDPPVLRRIVHADLSLRYSVADLSRFRRARPHAPPPPTPQPVEVDVESLRVSQRIRELIRSGWYRGCGYASRSELDAAVVAAMLAGGHTDDEIVSVFSQYAVGEKFRQKADDGLRYLRLTIDRMRSHLLYGGGVPGQIREYEGSMQIYRSTGGWVTLCPVTIRPLARLVGDVTGYRLQVGDHIVNVPHSAFSNNPQFRQSINHAAAWYGDDKDVQRLLAYLDEQGAPEMDATDVVGLHPRAVVYSDRQMDVQTGEILQEPVYVYVPRDPNRVYRLGDRPDWEEVLFPALRNLKSVHGPAEISVILGWFLSTFLAPRIRELTDTRQFPILCITGARGSGKTTIVEALGRLCGTTYIDRPDLTPWAAVSALASTNAPPVIIDEHRANARVGGVLYPLLRSAYNSHVEARGRRNLSVESVRLTAPVCVVGETRYNDAALLDRTVHVDLKLDRKGDVSPLRDTPWGELTAGCWRVALRSDVRQLWERAAQLVPSAPTDRQRHAYRVVVLGLILFGLDELVEYVSLAMAERAAHEEDDSDSVTAEFLRVLSELIRTQQLQEGVHYRINGDELILVRSTVLPAVAAYSQRWSTDAVVDRATVLHRLVESGVAHADRRRVGGGEKVTVVVVDLSRVEATYGIPRETFTWPTSI